MQRIRDILTRERAILIAGVMLFAALILLSLYVVRDIITFRLRDTTVKRPPTVDKPLQPQKSLMDYSAVVSNNPFGVKSEGLSPLTGSKKTADAVVTTKLRLIGAIAGNRGTGYAIIEDERGTQEVFKNGDTVFKTSVLEKVFPDSVTLKDGTRLALIEIPLTTTVQQPAPVAPPAAASDGFIRPTATNTYALSARKVQEAIDNPKALMTEARLQPRYNNGKQEGFLLQEVKQGGIYEQLGLKNGDVLLSINKYDITNPETGLQAFSALRGVSDLQLDILRGGTKVTLNYQIK
ncbi:Type II secretory pathway component PulC-like protein [Candidatus Magnetobacterium bavaricum]|uniref:Type II secretory pathway component PulC-like protein n=1 Tax=Candidatus Magnetobacterium bavaricum TaxID=29290 RepID=A0A0F3GRN2_9BACT|nr:Type II secretory pathway component PulC-like protein [Candidatus Magnetobacterium bavaricum]